VKAHCATRQCFTWIRLVVAIVWLTAAAPALAAQLTLTWTDNASNESGFRVERRLNPAGSYSEIRTLGPNVTTYADTTVTAGQGYCYRVRAYNSAGNSGYYDIYVVAGQHVAVAVTFPDVLVTDRQLTIDFVTITGNAKVSAIGVSSHIQTTYTQRLVAGGGAYTDAEGNLWSADRAYSPGSWGYVGGSSYGVSDPIANTQDDPLYQSQRYGDFSYKFDVPNGRYDVTLHFAEIYYPAGPGGRRFDVYIEGLRVLDDYDIYVVAGQHVAVAVTFPDVLVTDRQLTIDFVTITGNAKVSAIDILAAGSS
jgi:hypothetical protein